ncbi:MAG: hypothetical protein IPP08_02415 [Chlorobiota bacterium]|nr:hypothetical protein [Chlorobiota bacterium]QQS67048.1 MAG: hypothetical protein IPP08_02415 [Chlorobiota bacterium]
MKLFLLLFLFPITLLSQKINGVNIVSPKLKVYSNPIDTIKSINANWVAICPFAFLTPNNPEIRYENSDSWYGDKYNGVKEMIKFAKNSKLKILLKPHFWVDGEGWAGDYNLSNDKWKVWERNYINYILRLAKLADSNKVEMFCIGTEWKNAVKERPKFWFYLIDSVRKYYSGKLTYAANWDEYHNVPFWSELDFIGVDAYFPLLKIKTPSIETLKNEWLDIKKDLKAISIKNKKKILFTEYGYRSVNYTAWKQWEIENLSIKNAVNYRSQVNSYVALFDTFWNENWLAGGFIWKWYSDIENQLDVFIDTDYTPQGKPVEAIIKQRYLINKDKFPN